LCRHGIFPKVAKVEVWLGGVHYANIAAAAEAFAAAAADFSDGNIGTAG